MCLAAPTLLKWKSTNVTILSSCAAKKRMGGGGVWEWLWMCWSCWWQIDRWSECFSNCCCSTWVSSTLQLSLAFPYMVSIKITAIIIYQDLYSARKRKKNNRRGWSVGQFNRCVLRRDLKFCHESEFLMGCGSKFQSRMWGQRRQRLDPSKSGASCGWRARGGLSQQSVGGRRDCVVGGSWKGK